MASSRISFLCHQISSGFTIQKIFWSAAFLITLSLAGCQNNEQTEEVDLRIKTMEPEQTAQLAKSIEALVTPELAEGLSMSLWGIDSLVADPISLDIDNFGRVYYSKSNRRKSSEFDIRAHQDWEIASISLQTVEDRRAFLRKTLSPENSEKNDWLKDVNEDGSHDWRDLTVEKEKIYRLEDTNGDGVADMYQIVVEDFHEEVTDVAGALLIDGDDLFVGVAPDLWRLKDTNGNGIVDEKTSISHGYGVHIGFGGHGMSGLEMGPDGKIYWGIGDIGFNGVGPDGTEWKYPNRGVIVRANPDGSDFEVFAMGVRNTHEFVFDEYGNLISQDNDGDHRGESERLVYIVNGSDTGWRINWQFGKYRDPDNNTYKVWMDENMYKPRFEGQAAYITPCIANFVNGPTGMLYNPGTALSPKWKNTFFVAEFVGNPAKSGIHAFKLNPKGASFELGEHEQIMGGVLATGLSFGPDGAMYVGDWIDGWGNKGYGRIWKLDDKEGVEWEDRKKTQELLAADFTKYKETDLGALLQNPDMRVRQKAQFELAKRGDKGAEIFQQNIDQKAHQLARVHGIWGMAQLARNVDEKYATALLPLLKDGDQEIRAQAAKWLGDMKYKDAGQDLVPLLKDEYSRARFFAAEALGRLACEPAIQPIITMLEENNDEDAYLRHAGSLALARIGKADPVVALHQHESRALRIAAVVALRRMAHEGAAKFLEDDDEFIVTEAARAINDDFSIEAALPALGNVLKNKKFTNEALLRRAINANLRVGSEEALENLVNFALAEGTPVDMRAEALDALSTWAKPSVLDRVDGRYRGEVERDPAPVREEAGDMLIKLASNKEVKLRVSAVKAIGKLEVAKASPNLFALLKNDNKPEVRIEALKALAAIGDGEVAKAIEMALADREKRVRVAALDLLPKMDLEEDLMVALLKNVIETKTMEERQAAVLTLGTVSIEKSQEVFEGLLDKMAKWNLPPEIHLELTEAIDSTYSTGLKERLEGIRAELTPDDLLAAYQDCLFGGDEERGRNLLFRHTAAQCMRCHAYDDYGGNAGPPLNGIGDKLTRQQLLEALIAPSARIAPGYGIVTVELENEETISGILEEESDTELVIKVGDQRKTVSKDQVANRMDAPSSMPDMKHYLSKKEIRDLVSLLATLKKEGA